MRKAYITVDVETIVSGISKNINYLSAVYMGAMFVAHELKKKNLKATFFVSLSSKQSNIDSDEYLDLISCLVQSLKGFDNIKIAPHLHAYRLPVEFECDSDDYSTYSREQQVEMLNFSKLYFENLGVSVEAFRPGGFRKNQSYYSALSEAGFKYSSTMDFKSPPSYSLVDGRINDLAVRGEDFGIVEYPVSTVEVLSIKRRKELLNLSPDFFSVNSVKSYMDKADYINVNFHSFSIYINRLIRENHSGIFSNNFKFLAFEKMIDIVANKIGMATFNNNTVVKNTFLDWLEYFEESTIETLFIGE